MKNLIKFVLVSSLLAGVFGCSAKSSEKAADEARGDAANARVDAADANARLVAADVHLKAAEARVADANARAEAPNADAHVKTTTTPAAVLPDGCTDSAPSVSPSETRDSSSTNASGPTSPASDGDDATAAFAAHC